jgi:hypothetical protein
VLPQGQPPVIIDSKPDLFGAKNLKVRLSYQSRSILTHIMKIVVDPSMFDAVEEAWAPKDHPVFQLTSPSFEEYYNRIYDSIGCPAIDADSFWMIFRTMQEQFDALAAPELAAFATELRTAQ